MRKQGVLAGGAAAVTVVLWASAFVAIRHVGQDISAGALTLGRLLVGSVLLGIFVFTRPRRRPARADWKLLLACGLLWFGVYNVALNGAERHLDAGTTAMLVNIGPLLIALLAGILLGEGFPRQLVIGSVVAFAGVVVIALSSSHGGADAWGVMLCLVAAAAYAIGVVSQKPLLAHLPALEVTWLSCVIGAVACLPFGPTLLREAADARPATVWWVVFLGAFPTAIAFTTWAYALARTTAGRMGATTYLVPPITIFLGWLLLGESPVPLAYAGGVLCLGGVAISRYRRRAVAAMPVVSVDSPDSKPLSKS
ncbi:drug/metabolite transporter (DMT)-like permease [Kribbella sp. VKM Ac-2571]|uniref:DMT family transporter n=1 Tax=Kribbella sp. VKM Ac-2571 TaxID=2512222 RepID=UPI00105B3391|nr:DMT family transporter [Kribbella sp. VKM Ac-2571]TDO67536.1 drug/metabolite transporter (DMT)-like permease [Kribbella sp. VKM Ac-2571]